MSVLTHSLIALAFATVPAMSLAAQPTPVPTSSPTVVINVSNTASFKMTFEDVLVSSINSPRDAASGQATGKRTHKPIMMRTNSTTFEAGRLNQLGYSGSLPMEQISFNVMATLSSEAGKTCKAAVQAVLQTRATRMDVPLGDVARFFDASGNPRPEVCGR